MVVDSLTVLDKFTGEAIAEVPKATKGTTDRAIQSAKEAFPSWSRTPAHKRAAILEKTSRIIDSRKEEIAGTICREAGKAWRHAVAEAARSVETFRFSAEEARRIHGETVPMDASPAGEGRFGFWMRCPLGVVAAVSPFNFPLNLVAHKVGPALAAGNTVVLKPASATPLSAIKLAGYLDEAGLPPGVLHVLVGSGGTVGEWLTTDPRVSKISFTGSAAVGEEILRKAGMKKVTMELGNNSGVIVEPDADLSLAIPRCVTSAFANAGQVCISLQRLFVHEAIAKEFTERFVEAASRLKVGNPLDPDCDVGPMIDPKEAQRAQEWVEEAVGQGAKLLLGGGREGALMQPTVLADASPEMKVMCREAFAPLVAIREYKDFDDAVAMVEDTPYGLQAGIFTNDIRKAMRAVDRIDAGGIMINDTSMFRVDHMPYGGNKMSGMGREGVRFACEEMTSIKMVVIRP